jgi:hypothetical protein
MLITLTDCVSSSASEGGGLLPNHQERVIKLRQMRVEMLFPDTCPSNKEGGPRNEQQVQDDDTNDSGLKKLQSVGNYETANAGFESFHSLAILQKNDGQCSFHGIVEGDREQIAHGRPKV